MGTCVIFCAAEFDGLARPIGVDDFVIAADGGWRHTQALGLSPDAVLGDFDSLGYVPESARVFPVEKDDTDSMLAIRLGLKHNFREFILYGGMDGPRIDHTIANFQALQFLRDRDAAGYLVGLHTMATVISGETLEFSGAMPGTVSVFCMGPDAGGVTLEGLQYPLKDGKLTAGLPLGVSNHFTGQTARVSVRQGSLLVLWDREHSFPRRISLR
ncbi:MAG: thiamine diphosphokinase [Faecousia sp.]